MNVSEKKKKKKKRSCSASSRKWIDKLKVDIREISCQIVKWTKS